MSARISVVILTYCQAETTLNVLGSLSDCVGEPFDVLVRDNGSGDDSVRRIEGAFPDVQVEAGETNLGVAGGRNAAVHRAIALWDPEYLLFLDNDMEVTPGFVVALVRPLDNDSGLGQTQAKLLYMNERERINDGGGCRIVWWRGRTDPVGFNEIDRGQHDEPKPCMACCGGAMMVRASVFCELDGFDESFSPFGPEDLDFSLRLLEAGYHNLYVPDAVAYHAVSHTFGAGYTEEWARLKVKHWFRLLKRHATPAQQLGFYLVGGPLSVLQMVWRESRRGNFRAAIASVREAVRVIIQR